MSAEARFQYVAQQICGLVGCGSVYIFLGCRELELRHPLLNQVSTSRYGSIGSFGLSAGNILLQDERVRALCDVVMQTGQIQWCDHMQSFDKDIDIQSIAIAPLERPAGVLGFVLLTDSRAEAFSDGERLLLSQYLPQAAEDLEKYLSDMYFVPIELQVRSTDEEGMLQESNKGVQSAEQSWQDAQSLAGHTQIHQQIKELDRLKNEFISMVSHELRTPLTAIKGYAILLKAYGLSDSSGESGVEEMSLARQREYLDSIMEQTSHLEVLIADLLDISRIQAGRLSLRSAEVNMAPLCQRVVRLLQQRTDQEYFGRYKIECDLPAELPLVWADSDRVQQVLTNLLENAVKYSPDGGAIKVLVSTCSPLTGDSISDLSGDAPGSQASAVMYITVCDQGIGIAHDQLGQLFKPFTRLEHPLTADIPGVGLGLYITRKLVEAMGGTMVLYSSEGVGTSVTFTLPVQVPNNMVGPGSVPLTALTTP